MGRVNWQYIMCIINHDGQLVESINKSMYTATTTTQSPIVPIEPRARSVDATNSVNFSLSKTCRTPLKPGNSTSRVLTNAIVSAPGYRAYKVVVQHEMMDLAVL